MRITRLALLIATLASTQVHAGLFDDEEARKRVLELKTATDTRFDSQAKSLVDLANQIQSLRDDNARLRGQIETLTYELDLAKKRQQDFYLDLDTRVRKLEPTAGTPVTSSAASGDATKPAVASASDSAAEAQEYEAALTLFKGNKYKEAAAAFSAFVNKYPESNLAASAQFWSGNAWYALGDCKRAIDAQLVVATRWQESSKAPDSMLAIATCQQEMGNTQAARRTLETLVGKYPDAPAAGQARQRLAKKK